MNFEVAIRKAAPLRESAGGVYAFIHKSIQESLTALEVRTARQDGSRRFNGGNHFDATCSN